MATTGYKHTMTDKGLFIGSVKVLRPVQLADRPETKKVGKVVDKFFMERCVARFKSQKAQGRIFDITRNHKGKRIGEIVDQRVIEHNGQPVIEEDMLLTDKQAQQDWLERRLHEHSADVNLADGEEEVYATSLLDEGYGHFGFAEHGTEFIPETQLSLKEAGIDPVNVVSIRYTNDRTTNTNMELAMDAKELKEILAENNKTLLEQVDAKLKPVLELKKVEPAPSTDPLELLDQNKKQEQSLLLSADKQKAEKAKADDINEKVIEGIKKGVKVSTKAHRMALEKCDTQKERDLWQQNLLMKSSSDEIDLTVGGSNDDAETLELKRNYAEQKEDFAKHGVSEKMYLEKIIAARKGTNKKVEGASENIDHDFTRMHLTK